MNRHQLWCTVVLTTAVSTIAAQQIGSAEPRQEPRAQAQQAQPPQQGQAGQPQRGRGGRGGWQGPMDEARARELYVSNDHADHGRGVNFERQVQQKAEEDKRWSEVTKGVVDYQKIAYRSSVGDLDIPAYLFQPLKKRGTGGHAAMVWVHGGVHGNWSITYWPFVREAAASGFQTC